MSNKNNSSILDSVIEAQNEMLKTVVDNTKKFTMNNASVNEVIEKGTAAYQNMINAQKETFGKVTEKVEAATTASKTNLENSADFFKNWLENQNVAAKKMFDDNMSWTKNNTNMGSFTNMMPANMMESWNNWMNQANNQWMAQMSNPTSNWMNMNNNMFTANNFQDTMKKGMDASNQFSTQFMESMNSVFGDLKNNFSNPTSMDSFKGMQNMTEGFAKFYEMWMPMLKSMNEKTFNMDVYNQHMNPTLYKEFMDKMFGFMPQGSKEQFEKMNAQMTENMKNMTGQGMDMYTQAKNGFNTATAFMNNNSNNDMMNFYTTWYNNLQNTVSPLSKLMTPNSQTENMGAWKNISEMMVTYNTKNTEMQAMMYKTGVKAMDKIALNTMSKMKDGEDVNSMVKLYQEWLNNSDSTFVDLFNSDEYSKLMTEVSSLQMKIKQAIETQVETNFLNHLPIATRTQLEELYKSIYDLKKEVRNNAKNNSNATTTATTAPVKAATTAPVKAATAPVKTVAKAPTKAAAKAPVKAAAKSPAKKSK
jgi:hypothetical protein